MKTLYAVKTATGFEGWSRKKACPIEEAELHPTRWMAQKSADNISGHIVPVNVTVTVQKPAIPRQDLISRAVNFVKGPHSIPIRYFVLTFAAVKPGVTITDLVRYVELEAALLKSHKVYLKEASIKATISGLESRGFLSINDGGLSITEQGMDELGSFICQMELTP